MIKFHIGIIREGKIPHDKRVPFTPAQCRELKQKFPGIGITVQPSPYRCYPDDEFTSAGIPLIEDLSDCDILIGIKEVPVDMLIPEKTYIFFSHTIKKQPHNQKMFMEIVRKRIRLIDYECLTRPDGLRVLGFGRFAGIVGVHNGLRAYGLRHGLFNLKPAHHCFNREEMNRELRSVTLPSMKIAITGEGRVATGAKESLQVANIRQVTPEEYLSKNFNEPVFCQLGVTQYNQRKDGKPTDEHDFYKHPEDYETAFSPYSRATDLFISCHFWDPGAPRLFSVEEMRSDDFRINVIADISCDINGSIPSTIRSTTIEDPLYGFNPFTGKEDQPFGKGSITVMAVDNLPCELPRDASEDFGDQLMKNVMERLLGDDPEGMIQRAVITEGGKLKEKYSYLEDYLCA
ncbi:MAG: alanine dehydrogenase [Bacteroidetes bacterium]|nr:alanine dehydrogenase [Bacteroidota bacterium]